MKTLLIAAGMMAAMLGSAPATAAPVGGNAPAIEAPQAPQAMGERRHHNGGDRWNDRRHHDRWDRRGNRWGNRGRNCRNVRRGHRWVRVCGRR